MECTYEKPSKSAAIAAEKLPAATEKKTMGNINMPCFYLQALTLTMVISREIFKMVSINWNGEGKDYIYIQANTQSHIYNIHV